MNSGQDLKNTALFCKGLFLVGSVCFHRKFLSASVAQEAMPDTSWELMASCPEHRVGPQLPGTFGVGTRAAVLCLDLVLCCCWATCEEGLSGEGENSQGWCRSLNIVGRKYIFFAVKLKDFWLWEPYQS